MVPQAAKAKNSANRPAPVTTSVTYRDEYHPARPNSYEAYCKERLDKKKLDQVKRELGRRQREQEREESGTVTQPESERDVDRQPKYTSEDVTRSAVEGQFEDATGPRGGVGSSRAGLGYSRGVTSETRVGSGELQASSGENRGEADQKKAQVPTVALDEFGREIPREPAPRQDARRIVLLQNMVGPGEVDDELQEEVKGECAEKYGPVTKCVIYEVTGRVAPEEAVRIFVQFEREEGAGKGRGAWAVVFDMSVLYALGRLPLYSQLYENVDNAALAGLSGRFFGGRKVKATLYDEAKFERMDLTGQ
ncbi:hypothetical protein BBJ28_00000173 [Nothophytophthora sp. Chile5]|nr:hypothetical protein BBJ28_00000173 [Nothophytophthora sp. Chile5]